jgi:hypothetical protein
MVFEITLGSGSRILFYLFISKLFDRVWGLVLDLVIHSSRLLILGF